MENSRELGLICPSGIKAVIREQNGEDDKWLTNPHLVEENMQFNYFVKNIVVSLQLYDSDSIVKNPTLEQILDLKLNDKYFIVISSRIFSMGKILEFTWDWGDGKEVPYKEDLSNYIWDYTKPFPEKGDPQYFNYRISPYKEGSTKSKIELKLKSGKTVRYKTMDGHSEKYLLKLSEEQMNINSKLLSRDLEMLTESDGWVPVRNFTIFTVSDMIELRTKLKDDEDFKGLTDITNPRNGSTQSIPFLSIPEFFFPLTLTF